MNGISLKRRNFVKTGLAAGASSLIGLNPSNGCKTNEEEEVSPAEDLMREHGLLNRILLIYDYCRMSIIKGQSFSLEVLGGSATIIRNFVEDLP